MTGGGESEMEWMTEGVWKSLPFFTYVPSSTPTLLPQICNYVKNLPRL